MKPRCLERARVLTRAWQVRGRPRVGAVRIGVAALGLLAVSGAAYTVRTGDTLSALAGRHGVSVQSLVEANDLDDPDLIVVGQVLTIPGQADGAAAQAPSSTSSSGDGGASTHVVKSGESLAAIARAYGLSTHDLATANGITNLNRILAGSLLRIAKQPPPPPGTDGGRAERHTIGSGESLWLIAREYGASVGDIVKANDLADPDRIIAGQTLQIPGSGGGPVWACPVPGGTFLDDFGVAKPDGRRHEGVDVFAPRGTLIHAPVGGMIRHVEGPRAGLQFTLAGDDGYTYIGTHLDAYGPSGRVAKGDPIGTIGSTGNARGGPPHVHFEMHHDGVVNPFPTLREYC